MGGIQEFTPDQQMGAVQEFAPGQQMRRVQEFASDQQMGGVQSLTGDKGEPRVSTGGTLVWDSSSQCNSGYCQEWRFQYCPCCLWLWGSTSSLTETKRWSWSETVNQVRHWGTPRHGLGQS